MVYPALVAAYDTNAGGLGAVPVVDLLILVLGVPALAAAAAWLLAGREPCSLTAPRME